MNNSTWIPLVLHRACGPIFVDDLAIMVGERDPGLE
jgi:hypothetical protein